MKTPLLICIFMLAILCVAVFTQLPDQRLHVFICDIGQGDGMLIQKGSIQMIVDAGPDNSIQSCLGKHMPFWDRTIEVALMTHADSDHYFGFSEIARRYHIQTFIGSTLENKGSEYSELKNIIKEQGINVLGAKAGQTIRFSGVSFHIIYPTTEIIDSHSAPVPEAHVLGSRIQDSRNDYCAVGYLTYGNFSGLFTCDISPLAEEMMLSMHIVPHAYFLKIPHHGSKNGLIERFLDAVDPTIAAISVGIKNRYGHPSPSVIDMLSGKKVKVYRTDQNGEIEILTNGKTIQVTKQK